MNRRILEAFVVSIFLFAFASVHASDCGEFATVTVPDSGESGEITSPSEPDNPQPHDPVNLKQDTDIMDRYKNYEHEAGKDFLLPGMEVKVQVQVTAKGGNAGNWRTRDDADTIDIADYVSLNDGPWIHWETGYISIDKLDEDKTIQETKGYVIPDGIDSIAFRTFTDYRDEVYEYDESDNESRVERFEVSHLKPDLVVEEVYLTDTNNNRFYHGDSAFEDQDWTPRCVIANLGEIESPAELRVEYFMDGEERDTDSLAPYEPLLGQEVTKSANTWKLGDTGARVYSCCVGIGRIPELTTNTNCKSMTLNIVPHKSDIIVSDLYLKTDSGQVVRNGDSIPQDSVVKPYCILSNQGNRNARNGIHLKYEVDSGTYRGDDGLDASDLTIGASKTEYMSEGFRLGDTGGRTYLCIGDSKGEESELNENNNSKTMSFTVYPIAPRIEITDIYGRYNENTIRDGSTDKAGKDFAPNIVVKNVGNGPMKCKAQAHYYVDTDKRRDGDTIDPLGVGQSGHEYVSSSNDFKLGDKGPRTYRARVVSDCGEFPVVERIIRFTLK